MPTQELQKVGLDAAGIAEARCTAERPLHDVREKKAEEHEDQKTRAVGARGCCARRECWHWSSVYQARVSMNGQESEHPRIMATSDSTERFTNRVEEYERYRQRYPADEVLMRLRSWCGLDPLWRVADVGAGTGMLSEVFLANGNPVTAIEPNAEMRAACERLQARWPQLKVVNATAEQTGLADQSMEIVAAGRAFHWFDHARASPEFRRVLVPDGWVVLVSSGRAKDQSPQSEAFERLLVEFGTDYKYVRGGYRVHENLSAMFPRELHQDQIQGEQTVTWDELRGFALSLSVVPTREDARYPAFEQELRRWFEEFAKDGRFCMKTTCWVSAGRF
jgi:ubiquinone/menaquinone biosynthesis C-methylase UbiE